MPGEVTTTTAAAILKKVQNQKRVDLLFYGGQKLLTMLNKVDDLYGSGVTIPVQHGVPQGASHTFANALANQSAGNEVAFTLPRRKGYQIWSLENEAIIASKKDFGAFVSLLTNKADGAMKNLSRAAGISVYGNSGGSRGQIASEAADVITLSNAADVIRFEVDMVLAASLTDGTSGALKAGTCTITAIDRTAGTLTVDAYPGAWADDDYLFRDGDFGLSMNGLADWLPAVPRSDASLGTAFLGVIRSTDPVRLAGVYFDGSALRIEEALKKLVTRVKLNGGDPDVLILSTLDMEALELSLGNSVVRDDSVYHNPSGKKGASIGFDHIIVRCGGSRVRVYEDRDCPTGICYCLTMSTWKLHHMQAVPHNIVMGMGNGGGIAGASADDIQFRARYFANLACTAPGHNGVGILAPRSL